MLTEENYKEVKSIIEKRLKKSNIQDYNISVNNITGDITLEIPEDENTDTVISNLNTIGKFEIIDTDTNEVLLDNSNIKTSDVLYNTTTSGTSVYLQIEFNKEGKKKLEEISKTYVKTENNTTSNSTESEENTSDNNTTTTSEKTEKTITMKINDEDIMTTSFDEAITTGKIQLSVGTATTDTTTLKGYITQAQSVAVVLDGGKLPIQYDLVKNEYILSNITEQDLGYVAIAISVIAIIAIIVLVIIFKLKGLLAGISFIGFAAVYMLLIRYTNVVISLESIFGIISILILNYIFMFNLLKNIEKMDKNVKKSTIETYKKFFNRIIPICILAIAFCFVKWNPINSFGMITFWGIVMIAIYNVIVTANLLNLETKDKE